MEKCLFQNQIIYALDYFDIEKTKEIRMLGRDGKLLCFDCHREVIYKRGPIRKAHFSHKSSADCTYNKSAEEYQSRFPLLNDIKERLFNHLRQLPCDVELDANLVPNHWTDICVYCDNGKNLAVELDDKEIRFLKMAKTMEQYRDNNIDVAWFIAINDYYFTRENEVPDVIRLRLHTATDHSVFLIDKEHPDILIYCLMDTKHNFAQNIFKYYFSLKDLVVHDGKLTVKGLTEEYEEWIKEQLAALKKAQETRQSLLKKYPKIQEYNSSIELPNRPIKGHGDDTLKKHYLCRDKFVIENNILYTLNLYINGNPHAINTIKRLKNINPLYQETIAEMRESYQKLNPELVKILLDI